MYGIGITELIILSGLVLLIWASVNILINKQITGIILTILFLMLNLTGCDTDLTVPNWNEPDRERVFSKPEGIEALIGSSFLNYWNAYKSYSSFAISALADELSTTWCGYSEISSEPRPAWNNDPSYSWSRFNEDPWYNSYKAITTAVDGLVSINKRIQLVDEAGNDNTNRAEAYARFVMGISYGLLGCYFDKAFIMDETVDLEGDKLKLKPYQEVIQFSTQMLEQCITICETTSFVLPDNWINGLSLSQDELKQLAHSYIARIVASSGRSVEERSIADWEKIKYHADRGISRDFSPIGDGNYWYNQVLWFGQNPVWSRADYKTIGWSDTSGNHTKWIATPVSERNWYLIYTDDKRITGGDPQLDGVDFSYQGEPSFRPDRGTYNFSGYGYKRYIDYFNNGHTGPMPCFLVTELDLLKAEYFMRIGDAASAAFEINKTKVSRGGLAPAKVTHEIGTVYDARNPRGSLWAQLKYEKGIECFIANEFVAYYDRRGWGELVKDSPIHFPIPGKELEILLMSNYTFGGGGAGSAP